jgi:2-succinyl-5-enolpyruvyl-6-hydroxy-3-cyclohexene-1-carboxylate synthase
MAFARHGKLESIPVLDERSAAFFALGLAKRHQRPTVLICTSGTAGANYFPAVIEAQESGVALLVLTADRPPEMRECASGQTIDQQKLFGSHVNWYHEFAVPEASIDLLRYLRQTLVQAFTRTSLPLAGPVHLNLPFRDPLPPIEDGKAAAVAAQFPSDFFDHLTPLAAPMAPGVIWQRPITTRGVIIAGASAGTDPLKYASAVFTLARTLGWPILADALSPLRNYAQGDDQVVTTYDTVLRNAEVGRALVPRYVLCLGGWPISKVLRNWLEQSQAEILLVAPSPANRDALHGKTRQLVAPVELVAAARQEKFDASYRELWHEADRAARGNLEAALNRADAAHFEGQIVWRLAQSLPRETPIFIANSMPVRDAEYFWSASNRALAPFFNRGANGIDGTLSTALGLAHGGRPTVLLTGDLALLHDTNGLLHRPQFRGSLTIVLINNGGGGIFEHLPVAQFDPPFEKFFATPQEVDFAKLCEAYGVAYQLVRDAADFTALISTLPAQGIRVLEFKTDRKRDAAFRKKLFAETASLVAKALREGGTQSELNG